MTRTTLQLDSPPPRLIRIWLAAFAAALALYAATAAPGVLWGDSGDAQLRVLLGHFSDHRHYSRSHPLYYLIAWLVNSVAGNAARSATTVAVIAGAVTVANVAAWTAILTRHRAAAVCATIALALSHSLWHLSTVAEVMTLSTAFLGAELLCVTRFTQTRKPNLLIAALFFNGLNLATHNLAMLVWPAYALLIAMEFRRRTITPSLLAKAAIAMLLGAAPIIVLFVSLSRQDGSPLSVLQKMIAGRYAGYALNASHLLRPILKMSAYSLYSFATPVLLFSFVGLRSLIRSENRSFRAFSLTAFAFLAAFGLRYNVADQHVFMLHSYILLTGFIAIGLDTFFARTPCLRRRTLWVALSATAPIVYALAPGWLRDNPKWSIVPDRTIPHRDNYNWFLKPWRTGLDGPERFATETLNSLPENTVLMIDSTPLSPILYLQNANAFRRDVLLLGGAQYQSWYEAPLPVPSPELDAIISQDRLFTITDDRTTWNRHLDKPRYGCKPAPGQLFQITRQP